MANQSLEPNEHAWHFGGGAASGAKHARGSSVTLGKEKIMVAIDFVTPVRKEAARIGPAIGLVDAPEFSQSEYWFVRVAYRSESTLLFFDCETSRDNVVDVVFGPVLKKEAKYSVHTFLRLFDAPAAIEFGSGLPKDQRDVDDLLSLYSDALMKHRQAIFHQTEETIAAMEHEFRVRDFANQPYRPVGRFVR